jgi:hypothetical protein
MKMRPVVSLSLLSFLFVAACGSVSTSSTGGAGASGTGQAGAGGGTGTAGATGTAGTSGTSGTAGTTGTAGGTGTAGSTGAAGTTGTAGGTGTAGVTGTAGTGGHGGTTGAGGMSGRVPVKHRAVAVACSTDRAAGTCDPTGSNIPDAGLACRKDAECTAGANGRCSLGGRVLACQCTYDTCATDADCAQMGGPCECRPAGQGIVAPPPTTMNVCKAGNCRVDKDCGTAGYCSPSLGSCGNYLGVTGYYCHTAKDKCTDDTDCQAQGGGDCRYDSVTNAWACATSQCAG